MAMGPSPGITRDHRLVEISAGIVRGSDAVLATEREHERTHSHIQRRQQARKLPTFSTRG